MNTQQRNRMQRFTDKYFLRANQILKAENLNPWVNMQVFVRKGPGKIAGIDEAVQIITENSNIQRVGGRIYAKREGQEYQGKETIMNIVAPVQEIMELETVYLGVIAAGTTLRNDNRDIDLDAIARQVEQVVALTAGRPVLYFGARHWHYKRDAEIAQAAFKAGAADAATDNGAAVTGKQGVGTIPHALENVFAYYVGKNNAVADSTYAFDQFMDKAVPRIALVDYNNREITDTLATILALREVDVTRLAAVRVDTCGENVAEGGWAAYAEEYWAGKGVTVNGVAALRKEIDCYCKRTRIENRVGIVLSSGFSNPAKVAAFNEGEKKYNLRLYDAIGAGFLDGVRCATADIIAVGETREEVDYFQTGTIPQRNIIHKVGRPPRYNLGLERLF